MPEKNERLAYTAGETADLLGVSVMTVYRMVENGTLPFKRLEGRVKGGKGRIIIPVDALKKWLSKHDEPRDLVMEKKAQKIAKEAVSKLRAI